MKRLTIMGIIACVALLVGSASVVGGPAGPPGGLDVNVVNPVPLPVTGEVSATVTGPVDVNVVSPDPLPVTGDVNTTVTGPVDVNVVSEGPIPFQSDFSPDFTVPEGMFAVIEYFNWSCSVEEGLTLLTASLQTEFNDESVTYNFPVPKFPGVSGLGFSGPVKMFVQEEGNVGISIVTIGGSADCSFRISGYFYPVTD